MYSPVEAKTYSLKWCLLLKIPTFRTAVLASQLATYIHLWLVFLYPCLLMNESLSYVKLSLELHVVSTFWLGSDTQVLFLYILPSHHMNLWDQPWKILILWCRTDICSCKFSAKVSLMLDNPFLVSSFCNWNHTSVCFI